MPEFLLRAWAEQTLYACGDYLVSADTIEQATDKLRDAQYRADNDGEHVKGPGISLPKPGRLSGVAPLDPSEVVRDENGIFEVDAASGEVRNLKPTGTIRKFLDLSTCHLSPETCATLDDWLNNRCDRSTEEYSSLRGGSTPYGWFIYCDEHPSTELLPADLVACMKYSRTQGCTYILFDADAPSDDALPDLGGPA